MADVADGSRSDPRHRYRHRDHLSQPAISRLLPQAAFPTFLEMALAIEVEIRRVMKGFKTLSTEQQRLWRPVAGYLAKERRITALSQQLARLFADYGKYGSKMVSEWENSPTKEWQQDLLEKAILWRLNMELPLPERRLRGNTLFTSQPTFTSSHQLSIPNRICIAESAVDANPLLPVVAL